MTLHSAGFPGEVNDQEWAQLLGLIGNDGTIGMAVSPGTGDRMVRIGSGISNVGGVLAFNDSNDDLQLNPNNSSHSRIDRVILRSTWSNTFLRFTVRQGTPSSNPQLPSLTRDPGNYYEVSLARVHLSPQQGGLTSGNITREATPPAAGFYNISSIAQAPDAEVGSLIYYTAADSLRIGTSSGYEELASLRSRQFAMPDKPPSAGWGNSSVYYIKSGVAFLTFNMNRRGGGFTNESVKLGTMPAGSRPPHAWFGNVVNQNTGEAYLTEVAPNGVVTMANATFSTGDRLRGSVIYPIT